MSAIEKVAILLQQLPQLRHMAEEAEAQRRAQALQARREAIKRYREAAKEQEAAKERLAKAEVRLEALREKLIAEQKAVHVVYQEALDAARRFNTASRELTTMHAESVVEHASYRLHFMAEEAQKHLSILEGNRYIITSHGLFRRENPEVVAQLPAAQARLEKISAARAEIASLRLTEELAPEELAERVEAIMQRVVPPAPKPGTQAED